MYKYLLFWITILLSGFFNNIYCENTNIPRAEKGFIDLSNWDFERDGIVKLQGEWEFYWNNFYTPNNFDTLKADKDYINQPTNWNVKRINGKRLPNFGYATYRLKIKLNPKYLINNKNNTILRVKLIEAHAAYKLWIDTNLYIVKGEISKNKETFKPRIKPEACSFYNYKDTVVITINVANYFDTYMAGIDDHILIGTEDQLLKEAHDNEFFFIFSFSILFMLGVYHFGVFMIRRKETINLNFSLICFLFAIQSFFEGEKSVYYIFPNLNIVVYYKIWLSTLILFPLIVKFYKSLFPKEINDVVVKIISVVFIIYLAIVIFTPHVVYISVEEYFLYFGLAVITYVLFCIIAAVKNKEPYAVYVLISMLIPFAAAINDILFGLDLIVTGYYGPVGFLILIVSHSFLVSFRFAKAYEKVETLSDELKELNKTLEEKVRERTSELSCAYTELKETNATKNKIYSIISHDLKNIFQTLIGYSDLLIMATKKGDFNGIGSDAEIIRTTAKRAYMFFENLLEWSSSQTGLIKFNPEEINIKQIAYDCVELLYMQANTKKINLAVIIPNELTVYADKRMVTTIIRNLISNAIKFTHKTGKITVKTVEEDKYIEVIVTDTGVGMDDEKIKSLFEMDKLKSTAGTEAEKGTGMGLLLAKEFINANGGKLFVTSGVGTGSEFKFTLPKFKN